MPHCDPVVDCRHSGLGEGVETGRYSSKGGRNATQKAGIGKSFPKVVGTGETGKSLKHCPLLCTLQ